MMAMNAKQPFAMPAALQEPKFPALPAGAEPARRVCLPAPQLQGNIFGSFDESLLARAEALAAVDIVPHAKGHHHHHHPHHHHPPFKPDPSYPAMSGVPCAALPHLAAHPHPLPHPALDGGDLLDHLSPSLAVGGLPEPPALPPHPLAAAGPLAVAVGPPGGAAAAARRPGARGGPAGAGGVRRAVQAAAGAAGGDPGRRGGGSGGAEAAGGGFAEPEHDLSLRVADAVAQQHDGAAAGAPGLAGGGRGRAPRPRRRPRAAGGRRAQAQADLDRRPREALAGGLLRPPAPALLREDRRHRREAGPQEERGARLVLQPAPEAEAHEVLGRAL
ncbi:unnamed protein product, partial [Bubo scandiacus]